jgi:hypothetical protein
MSDFSRLAELAIKEIKHDSDPDLVVIQSLLRRAQEHDALLSDLLGGDIEFDKRSEFNITSWDLRLEVPITGETRRQIFDFLTR